MKLEQNDKEKKTSKKLKYIMYRNIYDKYLIEVLYF